jgi:hypothetical protein
MPSNLAPVTEIELLSKIEGRTARVGIIGLGCVGLPLKLMFSDRKSAQIISGSSPGTCPCPA